MRLNDLDLNQLVSLDALLREQSVSRAAENVFLSQPAMSSALRRLRETFQDELLVVVGRKMVLTPLAADLAQPVRDILLQIRAVTSTRRVFNPAELHRTISFVASDYAWTVFMPEVLRRTRNQAPHMQVRLRPIEYNWGELLENGTVDFALIADAGHSSNCSAEPIFSDTVCCIVWSRNRNIGDRVSLEQYLQMSHAVVEFSGGRLPLKDEKLLKEAGYSRNVEVSTPDFNALPHFVVGTERIASMPCRLAKFYAKHLPLKIIPYPMDVPPFVQTLTYHKYQELDQASTWFRDLLKSVGKEMPPA